MFSYFFLLAAVFSRILPHPYWGFTAVGASLLYFGARRSPRQFFLPVIALAATDYYLTTIVYSYPFHVQAYLVTWSWYLGACFLGWAILRKQITAPRVVGAALTSSTSFFALSNFAVWMSFGSYPHTFGGLTACYIAGLPFYRNDALATTLLCGVVFGVPVVARRTVEAWQHRSSNITAA
jgi:hypothetical protein